MNKFKLKKGRVVTSFLHATITEYSSDDEFIAALKVSPATIKHFENYPKNWEEIVNGKPAEVVVEEKPKRTRTKKAK